MAPLSGIGGILAAFGRKGLTSAGFMAQDVSSELILWLAPRLRSQRHAFLKGVLIFDLGICLVLLSLPIMALYVAIQMLRGTKKFMPPFAAWYAAMLFAIVPIRNILPGSPPPGAWIDQALVLWVLIALVVAMVLYIVAWHRYSE